MDTESEKFEVVFEFFKISFFLIFFDFHIRNKTYSQSNLIEVINTRNEYQFQYILDELKIHPDKKLSCFDGLSIFEKVLSIPNSKKFIELCLEHGSDFYKVNISKKIVMNKSLKIDSLQEKLRWRLSTPLRCSFIVFRKSSSYDENS